MKRMSIVLVVLIVSIVGASIAAAQEPPADTPTEEGRRGRGGQKLEALAETLGMEVDALHEALQEEGATVASVIEANGGDVEAIIADLAAQIAENSARDVDEITEHLTERFNTPRGEGEGRPGFGGRGPRGPRGGGEGEGQPPAPEGDST